MHVSASLNATPFSTGNLTNHAFRLGIDILMTLFKIFGFLDYYRFLFMVFET